MTPPATYVIFCDMQTPTTVVPVAEAARRLRVGEKTLRRWHKAGLVQFVAVGPTDRLHMTEDEMARVVKLMEPRPVVAS